MRWRLAGLAAIAALFGLAMLVLGRSSPSLPQLPEPPAALAPQPRLPPGFLPPSVSAAPGLPPGVLASTGSTGSSGASFGPGGVTVSPPGGGPELRWSVDGASDAPPEPADPLPGVDHYFLGNEPSQWRTDLPRHASAHYRQLRPGLDVKATPRSRGLTLTITATAEALRDTWFRWEGPARATVEAGDRLALATASGTLTQSLEGPVRLAETRAGPGGGLAYRLETTTGPLAAPGTFQVGMAWSKHLPTRLAGGFNGANDVHVAPDGTAVVVGETSNGFFANSLDGGSNRNQDAYVAKFSPDGALMWGAYIGGTNSENGEDLGFDSAGNVYVTGRTTSSNFPLLNPFQGTLGGSGDAFVLSLTSSGNAIRWSTYLGGGSGNEAALAIGVAQTGNVWIGGYTSSANFPVPGAFDPVNNNNNGTYPNNDAFIAELNPDGGLLFSSFFGADGGTEIYDLAFDPNSGDVYAVGDSFAPGINLGAATPAFQPNFTGTRDGVILRLPAANPSAPTYFSYLGGSALTTINSVTVDGTGAVFLGGVTSSPNFPLDGGLGNSYGGVADAFISKLRVGAGGGLEWSSLFGGAWWDEVRGLALGPDGAIWLTGRTQSAGIPGFTGSIHGTTTYYDAFVARVSASGTSLDYGTYVGGDADDDGRGVDLDGRGNVYVAGSTLSSDFPVAHTPPDDDGFIIKLDTSPPDGGVVRDGPIPGTDLAYQSGTTSLSGNWSGFADPDAPVVRYQLALGTTPGGADLTGGGFVDAGSVTAITVAATLLDGETYYVTVHAINLAGLESLDIPSSGVTVDATPPPDGGVRDGPGADRQYQRLSDAIAANWDAMDDPGSGTVRYEWAVGTTKGGTDLLVFTDAGLSLNASAQLSTTNGATYYVTVKAKNGAGLSTQSHSDGVLVDDTAPSPGAVLDGPTPGTDLAVQPRNVPLSANWSGFGDPESGIDHYEWAIGTTAGGFNVMGFTDAGLSQIGTSGVPLQANTTYYVTVHAFNGAGDTTPAFSDGVRTLGIDGDPCTMPGECASNLCRNTVCLPPGTEVLLSFSRDAGAKPHFGERVDITAEVTSIANGFQDLRLVMTTDGLALANPDGGAATCNEGRTDLVPSVPGGETVAVPVSAYVCRGPGEDPVTLTGHLEEPGGSRLTPDAVLDLTVDSGKVPVGCDCASAPGMGAVAALLWALRRRRRTG